jgi:hypothetical protein
MSDGYRCGAFSASTGDGSCANDAKWWFRRRISSTCLGGERFGAWVPRCGVHARVPPFSGNQRVPISQEPPQVNRGTQNAE